MLMTTILLSSAILASTSLVIMLVVSQLKQSTGVKTSTQAIFAADSGIECILFEKSKVPPETPDYTACGTSPANKIDLDNGAYYFVVNNNPVFKSIGRSGRSSRAFEIRF